MIYLPSASIAVMFLVGNNWGKGFDHDERR